MSARRAGRPAAWPVCRAHGGRRGLTVRSVGVRRGCGLGVLSAQCERTAAAAAAAARIGSAPHRAAADSSRRAPASPCLTAARDGGGPSSPRGPQRLGARA